MITKSIIINYNYKKLFHKELIKSSFFYFEVDLIFLLKIINCNYKNFEKNIFEMKKRSKYFIVAIFYC